MWSYWIIQFFLFREPFKILSGKLTLKISLKWEKLQKFVQKFLKAKKTAKMSKHIGFNSRKIHSLSLFTESRGNEKNSARFARHFFLLTEILTPPSPLKSFPRTTPLFELTGHIIFLTECNNLCKTVQIRA